MGARSSKGMGTSRRSAGLRAKSAERLGGGVPSDAWAGTAVGGGVVTRTGKMEAIDDVYTVTKGQFVTGVAKAVSLLPSEDAAFVRDNVKYVSTLSSEYKGKYGGMGYPGKGRIEINPESTVKAPVWAAGTLVHEAVHAGPAPLKMSDGRAYLSDEIVKPTANVLARKHTELYTTEHEIRTYERMYLSAKARGDLATALDTVKEAGRAYRYRKATTYRVAKPSGQDVLGFGPIADKASPVTVLDPLVGDLMVNGWAGKRELAMEIMRD